MARLRLRDFRNYSRLDAAFTPGFHLFVGNNAQGKTNILEAIYLLATLRSFRGVGGAQMIRHGEKGYFIGASVVGQTEQEIKIYWSLQERKLTLNGQTVRKLADYLGAIRCVVFCTEDIQLVKGPAARRRRFLDLLLSQTDSAYLPILQRYSHALRARNALLKSPLIDGGALESFTGQLTELGRELIRRRHHLMPRLIPLAKNAYARLAPEQEEPHLIYQSSVQGDFAVELAQSRARERSLRTTIIGPHRDELQISFNHRPASQFASEGQKRSLAIALKMAQAELLTEFHGSPPILLIDDVMGELDLKRRSGFLPLIHRAHLARSQAFITATEENWPRQLGHELTRWKVVAGTLQRLPEGSP